MNATSPDKGPAAQTRPAQRLVQLENCGIHRDGRWLVRDISLTIDKGEIVTLIGPNGAGKSTTAKLALQIMAPDMGTVWHRPGMQVAYVPQKINVDRTMPLSVERLLTITGALGTAEIDAALQAVDIGHLRKAQVANLSGGEFQRALLARALARKPDLLVLDEPAQGVDFSGIAQLYALISRMRDQTGCGVLLISHDLNLVMSATDKVICLNQHICCSGTPRDVTGSPEYVRLFGMQAAAALALYEHRHDHSHLPDGRVLHADGSITDHCHAQDGHHHHDPQEADCRHHHAAGFAKDHRHAG